MKEDVKPITIPPLPPDEEFGFYNDDGEFISFAECESIIEDIYFIRSISKTNH